MRAADYDTITEYLINHILKTFPKGGDIGQALTTMKPFDFEPLLPEPVEPSTEINLARRQAIDQRNELFLQSKIILYVKRIDTCEDNLVKAYVFIWDQCSRNLQRKIAIREDYNEIRRDPIKLLQAIKQEVLHHQPNEMIPINRHQRFPRGDEDV
jgi:hypothetical protein